MFDTEQLIIVDTQDQQIGSLDKVSVHKFGLLHRAFSIFVFNTEGKLLIQQRAANKYHSGGLWSNTCYSHPKIGEELIGSAMNHLNEEMGICCPLEFVFSFIYKSEVDNGSTEYEYDHVYFGLTDDIPSPSKEEVKDWMYFNIDELKNQTYLNPNIYTFLLRTCLDKVIQYRK
jgi:isopentenyl-diphosphate Delta-isomerase